MLIRKESFKVAAVASCEATRPNLNGVHVMADGTCEATDGHCLVRVHTPTRGDASEYPVPFKGWTAPEVPKDGFIIPTADAKAAAKLPPRKGWNTLLTENVLLESLNGRAKLSATDLDRWTAVEPRPVEGPFPNCDCVIPKADDMSTGVEFNPRLLAKTLLTLADALDLSDLSGVVLRFGKHGAMRIDARNDNGGQGTALIMPMKSGGTEHFAAVWPVK
jgi:hypothetical protein